VIGLRQIKTSLDHIYKKNLITNDFYQSVAQHFPTPEDGNIDLSTIQATPLNKEDVADIASVFGLIGQPPAPLTPKFERDDINGTQRNVIEGTLVWIFDGLQDIRPASTGLEVLRLMRTTTLTEKEIEFLEQQNFLEEVEFLQKIYNHPCPQNRAEGYLNILENQADYIVDGKVQFEPEGLLGLTSRNDKSKSPITKEATIAYIHNLLDQETAKLEQIDRKEKIDRMAAVFKNRKRERTLLRAS
jgi:hypothetical protein